MPFKSIVTYLVLAVLLLAASVQALLLALPWVAESVARSRLEEILDREGLNWAGTDFSVAKIGLTRILVKDIRLGEDLALDTAELRYRWKGRGRVQVNRLVLSGLHLTLHLQGGGFRFNDTVFPGGDRSGQRTGGSSDIDLARLSPWIPEQIRVKHARVSVRLDGEEIQIPVDLLARLDPGRGTGDIRLALRPLGQTVYAEAAVDMHRTLTLGITGGITRAVVSVGQLNPECLARMFPGDFQWAAGPVDIRLTSRDVRTWEVNVSGAGIRTAGLPEIRLDRFRGRVVMGEQRPDLKPDLKPDQKPDPDRETETGIPLIGMHLAGKGEIRISGAGLSELGMLFSVTGDMDSAGGPSGEVTLESRDADELVLTPEAVQGKNMPERIRILKPDISVAFSGDSAGQTVRLELSGTAVQANVRDWRLGTEGLSISVQGRGNLLDKGSGPAFCFESETRHPKLASGRVKAGFKRLSGNGCIRLRSDTDGGFHLKGGEVKLSASGLDTGAEKGSATASGLKISAGIKGGDKGALVSVNLNAGLEDIHWVSGDTEASAARAGVSGTIRLGRDFTPVAALDARVENLSIERQAVVLSGIDLRLPMSYPFRSGTRPGRIEISRAAYDNRISARVEADLYQTGDGSVAARGRITSREFPEAAVDMDLKAGMDPGRHPWADIRLVSESVVLTQRELARIFPGNKATGTFRMPLSADIGIALKDSILDTRALIGIREGSLALPDLDARAEGISGRIEFNDLLTPESLPGQSVFVERAEAGQFRFDRGIFRFSIEDGRSVNIENIRFNWCNGLVSTESVRLPPEDGRLALTLYCDRLEMDRLLRQIGAFDAEGGGTLSGRIPVVYNRGDISFENGFLFSTPGKGGRVFVRDLDRMLVGFPKNTPEFSQLDLAGEALKDFEYKWATLRMNTKGETLEVKMELDGKPHAVLPFEYKKDFNSFVRVDASSPGSRFQGVKLDVNLKLPFNRMLKFGNKLKQILD